MHIPRCLWVVHIITARSDRKKITPKSFFFFQMITIIINKYYYKV